MIRSRLVLTAVLIVLSCGAYSQGVVSYKDLRSAYLQGLRVSVVLDLSSCTQTPGSYASLSSEQNDQHYLLYTRFNLESATLRGQGGADELIVNYSKRLPHTPATNSTSIGALYDVATDIVLTCSEEVYFFLKAEKANDNIEYVRRCPWSALTVDISK